jgi:FKBP-type peptidyl-prolyl cis-trans isomerase FklB
MKITKAVLTLMMVMTTLAFFPACSADKPEAKAPDLATFEQKISYVFGREIGQSFQEAPTKVDLDAFMRGIQDAMSKRPSLISTEEEEKAKTEFSAKMQEEQTKRVAAVAEKNQKEEEAFLAKNKSEQGVVTTASGLQYQVVQEGTGDPLKETDKVKVHYRGTLIDGTEFDSSYSRNEPAEFEVGGVIPGWTEGLQLMKVGGKYRLWVPSKLAYGARGAGRTIGPNTLLIFEVEPLEVVK